MNTLDIFVFSVRNKTDSKSKIKLYAILDDRKTALFNFYRPWNVTRITVHNVIPNNRLNAADRM